MLKILFYCLPIIFTSCTNYGQLKVVTDLPSSLEEISGMASYNDSTIWALEDNGNKDEIYQVNFKGDIVKSLKVKNGIMMIGKIWRWTRQVTSTLPI